jgi:hypothetical protein
VGATLLFVNLEETNEMTSIMSELRDTIGIKLRRKSSGEAGTIG